MRPLANKTFFLAMFFVSSIVISLGGYFYYKNVEKRYINEIESKLASIGMLKIRELEHWKKERFGDAYLFSKNENFSVLFKLLLNNPDDKESRRRIYNWLNQIKNAYDYEKINLFDLSGKLLLATDNEQEHDETRHFNEISLRIKDHKKIQLIDIYTLKSTGKPHMGVYIPIFDNLKADSIIGTMTFCINPEKYLYPFIQTWPGKSESGETLLLRGENDSVVFLNSLKYDTTAALSLKISFTRTNVPAVMAANGLRGIVYGDDYRGIPVIAYISDIPGFDWFLVAKIDKEQAYSSLKETIFLMLFLFIALILGSGISMRYLWKRQALFFYQEKYETEKNLREKQELYKTLINNLPQRVFLKDTNFIYISCNEAFAKDMNLSIDEIIGKSDFDFCEHESAIKHKSQDLKVISESALFTIEEDFIKDNQRRVTLTTKLPVFSDDGKVIGILGIYDDITKRKQNEEELEKNLRLLNINKERLEVSQAIAHVASWEYDIRTGKIWGSPEGFRIYGLEPAETGELPIEDIENCIPERERVHQAMVDLLSEEKEYNLEFDVVPANGLPIRRIISIAKLVRDDNGAPIKVSGFIQDITEIRKAEKELRESQKLFETVANSSPALLWMSDITKSCTWFNDVWLEFTGKTLEEEKGDGWARGVHPDDYDRCLKTYCDAFDKREVFEMEYRLLRNDGEYRWIFDKGQPMLDSDENFVGYIGSCIDINERKKIESLLSESEEKYRLLAETATDIILIHNFDRSILYINRAGCDFLNNSGSENFIGNSVLKFVPEKYHDLINGYINERINGLEGPRKFEIEFINKSGSLAPFEVISAPIIKNNKPVSLLVIARNIAERKRIEAELRILNAELESRIKIRTADLEKLNIQLHQQIEERIQMEKETAKYAAEVSDLYNNAPCGYHSLDKNGYFVQINDTELSWLGYEREEIINKMRAIEIMTSESKEVFFSAFPLFKTKGRLNDLELDFIRKDGSFFSVLLNATAVYNQEGTFIKSRSTIFDITEIKNARREIETLNKELFKRAADLEITNKELEAFA